MKSWNCIKKEQEETPQNVVEFLIEIEEVCRKYNLSISHEDSHGSFEIVRFDSEKIDWLNNASLNIKL